MSNAKWTDKPEQPLSEMPIWARLAFMEMVPKTYFWDEMMTKPQKARDAIVRGFTRQGDVIWIYYTIVWSGEKIGLYICPACKPWEKSQRGFYMLDAMTDHTAFADKRDQRTYHLCDIPMHKHHVPFPFANCLEKGSWIWEWQYLED